uniref:Ig-like domain-containing protein n=1 Tax=Cyclopterus lumpus TaxID=8103 RepID=A0A8C2ZQD4_CYCLU
AVPSLLCEVDSVEYLYDAHVVFPAGQTALVQSQHTVMAAVGDSACLTCRLMQFKDVLQVTWEKILPEGKKNLATSTKYFGQKVSREFKGRVEFKDIDLHNSSIVIMNVTDQDKGCYRCLFNTYPDGALTGTTCLHLYGENPHTVMAAVGDSACLTCRLMQFKDVLQVTWEKILPEGKKNLATSSKYFGQKVSREFKGRVEFKDTDLHNSSIVIMNVTDQDKGCYRCLFNTYPDDTSMILCLFCDLTTRMVFLPELREVFLHVRESHAAEEVVVSCSATGRPAPTVTLTVPHYNSTSSTNANGTVTVTATAVLPRLHVNSSRVGCAVRVLSGPETVVSEVVPEVKQSPADGETHS